MVVRGTHHSCAVQFVFFGFTFSKFFILSNFMFCGRAPGVKNLVKKLYCTTIMIVIRSVVIMASSYHILVSTSLIAAYRLWLVINDMLVQNNRGTVWSGDFACAVSRANFYLARDNSVTVAVRHHALRRCVNFPPITTVTTEAPAGNTYQCNGIQRIVIPTLMI